MNFKEAYQEMQKGKKIRRKEWAEGVFYNDYDSIVTIKDAIADDWKVVEESKVWSPKKGEKYWYIYNAGDIVDDTNDNSKTDEDRFSIGNCFKIEEEAKHMVKKLKVIKELKDFALENNKEEIDWSNTKQSKYAICCDYQKYYNKIFVCNNSVIKQSPFNIYFTSEELANEAIEKIGEDRIKKYYFDIEEE